MSPNDEKAATSLTTDEPREPVPLRHLSEAWAPVFAHLKDNHEDAADWEHLDALLAADLRAAVEDGSFAEDLPPFEKALKEIAKEEKTAAIEEIRDCVVVLRAWAKKRPIFEDDWLNEPASEEDLRALQDLYETPLPLSLLVSYRLYNGITSSKPVYMNRSDLLFLPVREILREYQLQLKHATQFISDAERKEKWQEHVRQWLPMFASNGNAMVYNMGPKLPGCADGRAITTGTIFEYNHEDVNLRQVRVRFTSLMHMLEYMSATTEL